MTSQVNSVINLNIPSSVPDGFTTPEVRSAVELFLTMMSNMQAEFERYVGATQKDMTLWSSLTPSDTLLRHQAGRLYVIASENLNSGDFVNLFDNGGVLTARKSNATSGTVRPARGFCSTAGGILLGAIGEVILSQGLLTISGIVSGQAIFTAKTAGQATVAAPTGVGELEQFLGFGIASNLAYIDISQGNYIQH
jgi:hypothetical protein